MHLQRTLDKMNIWRGFKNKTLLRFPLTENEINEVAEHLDCEMSPENLHCDGEISRAEAVKKGKYFLLAFKELQSYAKIQGIEITKKLYEIS